MSATINLFGPLEVPGAPQITPQDIDTQVNAALLANYNATGGGGPFLPLTGGSVAHLNISNIPLAKPDGSPPDGAIKGDLYNNGGFVCIAP